ncbi:multidrug resistance protein [Mollisia scopiformis]|uniref:Multidrug resistance protein n=1 Tax=Mollisia scopiformis TaxID=149040 RepID=A0A194XB54_MOLSC|nr:multidrug resistance protein [Mollisia scopiformis]KUJ17405.1 multidrug resistance protein [Mollisia scopiformis]
MSNQKELSSSVQADSIESISTIQYSVFSKWRKRYIVGLVALAAWFSTLSSFIYYPSIPLISKDLHLSIAQVDLSITTYMAISAIAPSITGDASDIYGRRPMYLFTLGLYLIANIVLATQSSFFGLLLLRMLQSAGISGAFSIAYGVVTDVAMPSERGSYVGALTFGITSAPALGPLIGGAISHSLGWRWIFWFLSIVSGACLTAVMLLLPETARGVVGNGSLRPPPYSRLLDLPGSTLKTSTSSSESTPMKRKRSFPNPLKSLTLLLSKDNAAVAFAGAFLYTTFCCISASLGTLFVNIYQLNELQAGLIYLPFGIGCSLAAITSGKLIDRDYRIMAKLHGLSIDRVRGDDLRSFPIEMARLRSVFVPLVVSVVSVIGFGWAVEKVAPLAVPLVIQFISGLAIQTCFNATNTLRVDINPRAPAAAQASSNFVRCTLAAIAVAFLQDIIDRIGVGPTFTFFGCLCSLSGVLFVIERKWGMKWRLQRLEFT